MKFFLKKCIFCLWNIKWEILGIVFIIIYSSLVNFYIFENNVNFEEWLKVVDVKLGELSLIMEIIKVLTPLFIIPVIIGFIVLISLIKKIWRWVKNKENRDGFKKVSVEQTGMFLSYIINSWKRMKEKEKMNYSKGKTILFWIILILIPSLFIWSMSILEQAQHSSGFGMGGIFALPLWVIDIVLFVVIIIWSKIQAGWLKVVKTISELLIVTVLMSIVLSLYNEYYLYTNFTKPRHALVREKINQCFIDLTSDALKSKDEILNRCKIYLYGENIREEKVLAILMSFYDMKYWNSSQSSLKDDLFFLGYEGEIERFKYVYKMEDYFSEALKKIDQEKVSGQKKKNICDLKYNYEKKLGAKLDIENLKIDCKKYIEK